MSVTQVAVTMANTLVPLGFDTEVRFAVSSFYSHSGGENSLCES